MPYRLQPPSVVLAVAFFASVLAGPARAEPPRPRARDATPAVVNPAQLQVEPDSAPGAAAINPFAAAGPTPAAGSVLTAPVTLNANTAVTTDAFTATQTGAGRAFSGIINKTSNTVSAIKGLTNGSGAGVNGVNTGTAGPSGKFQITNAASAQPGLVSTTAGTGTAILGVITNDGPFDTAAITGQHNNNSSSNGIGVEGDGGRAGVKGVSDYYGVQGVTTGGVGVFGTASNGGYGVAGTSNYIGVYGYTSSASSYAGYFFGPLLTTSTMTAQSYATTSDRNEKQAFEPIDNASVLDKLAALPISAWDYRDKPGIRHIGPMAQDFRAAFGLGADDKHIDMVDAAGVSLAAIQALQQQLKAKDARIAALEARNAEIDELKAQAAQAAAAAQAMQAQLSALVEAQAPLAASSTHP